MTVKRTTAVLATLMAATGLTLVGAPDALAADGATVYLSGNDGTYFSGTVNFTNRSASVDGVVYPSSNRCRRVNAAAFDSVTNVLDLKGTRLWCTMSSPQHIPLTANVPGGASKIGISLLDPEGYSVDICWVTRGDTSCR
ncbi:hypothetical protein AB0C38_44325 [Amycolatopsis sp. NPDC048633]|uniref:hypothetical protein n=1 Tax=Amycolatopsis sp. NPDC048633 TaxID=3157095 RepID=UPI0033D0B92D